MRSWLTPGTSRPQPPAYGVLDVVRQFNTGLGVNVITQEGLANTSAMDAAIGAMVVDGP